MSPSWRANRSSSAVSRSSWASAAIRSTSARLKPDIRADSNIYSYMTVRQPAVAGSWYPGSAEALTAAVDRHLAAAADGPTPPVQLIALIAPHAGLIYSGPVAAYSYRWLPPTTDLVVLVGPSHFLGFAGVAAFD